MVRKALFWAFAGQISAMVITFAGSVVVARLLTPQEMGVYAVATATIGILQIFTSFGIGLYVTREEALTPETVDAAFTLNAALSALMALVLFVGSFAGARFSDDPGVAPVLQLLAITPLISSLGFTPGVMLQRAMLFRGTSIIATLAAIIATSVTIGAALAGARYESPAYGAVASAVFSTVAVIVIGREHFSLRFSVAGWRRMLAFGVRMMSIGGIASSAVRVSDLILGHMLGLVALGLYGRATSINNLLMQNIYGTMTRVVFAKLSEAQREGGDVSAVYMRGLRLIGGIMGPVLIGLAILAGPVVRLLYGERWLEAALPLSLLLVSQFVSLSFAMNWELFVIRDRLNTQTKLEITRSLIGVTTQLIGSLFSLIVVAATSIIDNVISALLYGRYMPGLTGLAQRRILNVYGEACFLTALAVAPSLLFMIMTGWRTDPSIVSVAVMIAVGVGVWLAALFKMRHPLAEELEMLWAKIFLRPDKSPQTSRAE